MNREAIFKQIKSLGIRVDSLKGIVQNEHSICDDEIVEWLGYMDSIQKDLSQVEFEVIKKYMEDINNA